MIRAVIKSHAAKERTGRHTGGGGILACILLALSYGASIVPVEAQQAKPTEYDVKAAYLSNFGRFVEWPAATETSPGTSDPAEPFNICVLGA
ncbi:MAG TPA: YfiR family protein, partial [Bryobacteraceae bacterium]|nr:YfiR family protein [Bryobacteraceae bacterium]